MNTIWIVIPVLLVLMFLLGTDLHKEAFANVARNPRAVLAGMTGQLVFSMLAKGDVALSVTLTAFSSVITLFTLPLVMGGVAELVSQQAGF